MTDTAQQQKKTLLMTEGSIWKSILLFSVPLILGNLLQQLYNTADSIIVGNFLGSNALAAVGSSGSPIYLLIGFSQGVAVGAGVVVSQYLGAKDKRRPASPSTPRWPLRPSSASSSRWAASRSAAPC